MSIVMALGGPSLIHINAGLESGGHVARVNVAIRLPLARHQFDALASLDVNTGRVHCAKLSATISAGEPHASWHVMGWLLSPEIRMHRSA